MAKQTFTTGQVLTAAQMTSLQQTAMLGGSASAKTASYTLVAADAGTAITMSNASATTITVNTGLFAAGDTVTILNIGAGTCTVTAGTATVSKPTNASLALVQNAGGVLYFTATGAATFLPFDSGTSGTTLITRNAFTNVAGVNIDNIFTTTYENYLVVVEEIYGTALDDLQLQFRYGSTTQTANYYGGANTCNYLGTAGTTGTNNLAHLLVSTEIGNSTYPSTLAFYVTRVGDATDVPMVQGTNWSSYNSIFSAFGGYNSTARVYTGLRFTSSSGNIWGVVSVYGYAKA